MGNEIEMFPILYLKYFSTLHFHIFFGKKLVFLIIKYLENTIILAFFETILTVNKKIKLVPKLLNFCFCCQKF